MSETKTVWHQYPKEKPNVPMFKTTPHGRYYTTYVFLVSQKRSDGTLCVDTSPYSCGEFMANSVVAWAELPEPYKEVDECGE